MGRCRGFHQRRAGDRYHRGSERRTDPDVCESADGSDGGHRVCHQPRDPDHSRRRSGCGWRRIVLPGGIRQFRYFDQRRRSRHSRHHPVKYRRDMGVDAGAERQRHADCLHRHSLGRHRRIGSSRAGVCDRGGGQRRAHPDNRESPARHQRRHGLPDHPCHARCRCERGRCRGEHPVLPGGGGQQRHFDQRRRASHPRLDTSEHRRILVLDTGGRCQWHAERLHHSRLGWRRNLRGGRAGDGSCHRRQ